MGLFDVLGVMKDIVVGGVESYKAGEKLDELIGQVENDYKDALTATDKDLLKKYKQAKKVYDDNTDTDKTSELLEKMEDARIEFLESVMNNSSVPKSFSNEISAAIEEFKKADNKALNSLEKTLDKYAENDEQRNEIHKTLNESKRK